MPLNIAILPFLPLPIFPLPLSFISLSPSYIYARETICHRRRNDRTHIQISRGLRPSDGNLDCGARHAHRSIGSRGLCYERENLRGGRSRSRHPPLYDGVLRPGRKLLAPVRQHEEPSFWRGGRGAQPAHLCHRREGPTPAGLLRHRRAVFSRYQLLGELQQVRLNYSMY